MKGITYDIHGILKVRVEGLSPLSLQAFNCAYGYFRSEAAGREPDISVAIGRFRPDLAGCVNVDHKFFLRRDYVYFRDTDKGLGWEAEIRGLEGSGPLRVRFRADAGNRLRFPWCLFPEMVLNLYVLQPLLEFRLWRQGHFLLHSAGVEKDGRACLIAGRGGAHKTTMVMHLLRRGWRLLGDDMVLVHEGLIKSFPTVVEQLEYLLLHCETETMGFRAKMGLFGFLAANRARGLPAAVSATPAAVNLVFVKGGGEPALREGWDSGDLVASLAVNHLMERNTYVGFKFSTAAFLDAYAYAFPDAGFDRYPADLAGALRRGLADVPFRVLELPRRWDGRSPDLLLLGDQETGRAGRSVC